MTSPTPQPCETSTATRKPLLTLGILNNYRESDETRLFLTPEACGMLHTMGIRILMESGAGIDITYSDEAYAGHGVEIVTRVQALHAEMVISVRSLKASDVMHMRPDATLMTLADPELPRDTVQALLDRRITLLAIDRICSANQQYTFERVLEEIDGRAAILYAQEGLSFLGEGKGVLLSGIAGVEPCEVLIIGEGCRVQSAAKAALSAGARVTLMDNDISALFDAEANCGPMLNTSAIHPHVLYNKVKSADVIILDACTREFDFPKQLSAAMKDNVYLLDMAETIPSLIVPRTVAMAMSNVMLNFLSETLQMGGIIRQIQTMPGVQNAVVTYQGRLTDKLIALRHGLYAVNISVLLSATAN
ncbi:MAG: hypothetical protein HDS66_01880 [Bacteroidales bacterium]|nr:hypothetical protein [Bacteroidales bacterium]